MKIDLRDYQVNALDAIEAAEREGVRRPLVVHPTGTGKGVVMGAAAARRADRGRSLVLVHRQELADQFVEKLNWQAPGLEVGIVKAGLNQLDAPVVVASVDTVKQDKRLAEMRDSALASPFGTIIVDEAHHSPSPGWTKVLTGMGAFNPYGPLAIGFTATPERDGKTLGVWERVVHFYSIRQAIYDGNLVPILPAEVIETKMDLDQVKKTGGDYSGGDLGQALEDSGAIEEIADAYVEKASDRKGVAFTPTIKTAHALAEALCARGIRAEAVSGQTDPAERKAILLRLKTGATQVVTNCAVLTEGFDEPSISCVVVARPTVFHGLYVQMIGRGTRLCPGKKNLLILDVVGASQRHELVGVVDLGLELDDPVTRKGNGEELACKLCGQPCQIPEHRCGLCHRYLPVGKIRKRTRGRHDNCKAVAPGTVDVFGASRLRWLPVENGWCLGAGEEVVVMVPSGVDVWKLAAYRGGRIEVLHEQLPSDWAMGIGEDRAKAFQKLVERDARWLSMPATDAQKSRLLREGLPEKLLPAVKTKGDAADLSTRIQGRRAMRRLAPR